MPLSGCLAAPTPGVHLEVRGRAQRRSLSCESRSACDVLGFLGHTVPEERFLDGLARSDNPELGFVGSLDDPGGGLPPAGYGVYEEPIAARMRAFGVDAVAVNGVDVPWLRARLDERRPVIVWATARFDAPAPVTMRDRAGRAFPVVPYEHTFLAVGYGGGKIVLLDPATGTEKDVAWRVFDRAWALLGRRAVFVCTSGRPPS